MYWITGDVHFPIDWNKIRTWYKFNPQFTKGDTIIICGDAGFLWDNSPQEKTAIKRIGWLPFNILFVDGNHENFNLLEQLPQVEKYGGPVGQVSKNIFHLKRGNVYTIDEKKVWVMGGAPSHDKEHRVEGKSWWKEEIPSISEQEQGVNSLIKNNATVNIIITHEGPDSIIKCIHPNYGNNELSRYLEFIKNNSIYDKWFFGHYHIDYNFDNKHYCLYNDIIPFG